jgi:hypothetical protein
VALDFTQPLTEMSTVNFLRGRGVKHGQCIRQTTSPPSVGCSTSHLYGFPQPVTGISLQFFVFAFTFEFVV